MSWPIKLLCESNIILCGGLVERIGCAAVAKRIMHDGDGVAGLIVITVKNNLTDMHGWACLLVRAAP